MGRFTIGSCGSRFEKVAAFPNSRRLKQRPEWCCCLRSIDLNRMKGTGIKKRGTDTFLDDAGIGSTDIWRKPIQYNEKSDAVWISASQS